MKRSITTRRVVLTMVITGVVVMGLAWSAYAETISYWRFEDGSTTDNVRDTDARTTLTGPGINGVTASDSSGNGNILYAWEDTGSTAHMYRSDVPESTVPQTGATNARSVQDNGASPGMFTWSAAATPSGTNLDSINPAQWTIEVSVKPTEVTGYHGIITREGRNVATENAALASLYLQIAAIGDTRHYAIKFADDAGNWWQAIDSATVTANQWCHLAAVSDGSTLKLYKDLLDGNGYQLAASTDISSSADSDLVDPGLDGNGDQWGWAVSRGRYGWSNDPTQDHGDRFLGYIDEVRISDAALGTSEFLFVPEPSTFVMAILFAVCGLALGWCSRRKR